MSEEELPEPEFPNVVGVYKFSSNTVLTNVSPSVIVVDTAPSTITLPDTNDLLIKGMKYVDDNLWIEL